MSRPGRMTMVGLATVLVWTAASAAAERFQPEHLRYVGAFRLPSQTGSLGQGQSGDLLSWCKGIEAYSPDGDPAGPSDGFPGSLYGVGHAWVTPAFEIGIPAPVVSSDVTDLPVATLLQEPQDVHTSIGVEGDQLKGIEYLPAQPGMSGARLHISFGQHYQYDRRPTHGWVNLDLSNAQPAGPWHVGAAGVVDPLNTNEYVFSIPKAWADAHAGGKRLACGRHREGQVASGPSIIAYAPWESGNPPPAGTDLSAEPLVLYKDRTLEDGLEGHCWADNWTGGAWLDSGEKTSVVIVGTKGLGDCWYGWQDGMTPEVCNQMPGGCDGNGYSGSNRGYYASYFKTVILFYDPEDLAGVAQGTLASHQPQPYRMWDITPYMFQPETQYEIGTGGVAYDQEHGYLFVTEFYGERARYKPVVHVFALDGSGPIDEGQNPHSSSTTPGASALDVFASPNPFRDTTTIHLLDLGSGAVRRPLRVAVYDIRGHLEADFGVVSGSAVEWGATRRRTGIYFVRAWNDDAAWTSKISIVR